MVTLTEGRHPGEFILSEANFHRSRGAGHVAVADIVTPGMVVRAGVAATTDTPATYTQLLAATGNAAIGIVIYGAAPVSGEDIDVALIVRDAEVNGKVLVWPDGITNTEKGAAIAALAVVGIIVR